MIDEGFIRTVAYVVVISSIPISGMARELVYSWNGRLELHQNATSDPWSLGATGANFELETVVSSTAMDEYFTQAAFAGFTPTSTRLWVDGVETLYIGGSFIDFADSSDVIDAISSVGRFSRFGQSVVIASVVALDPSAFSFSLDRELPPMFEPMRTTALARDLHSPYVASVAAGTLVTIVPEPESLLLLVVCIIRFVVYRRREAARF